MPTTEIIVSVRELRSGDAFHDEAGRLHWTALSDAALCANGDIQLRVQYADGGVSVREWSAKNSGWELAVERSDA